MKFAASLTVGGLIGFVILEALKILLAPVAVWLMAVVAVAVKVMVVAALVLGACLAVGVGVYVYRRTRREQPV